MIRVLNPHIGGFPKFGVPFGGTYNEDYSIFGSKLGFPYFREATKVAPFHPKYPML